MVVALPLLAGLARGVEGDGKIAALRKVLAWELIVRELLPGMADRNDHCRIWRIKVQRHVDRRVYFPSGK